MKLNEISDFSNNAETRDVSKYGNEEFWKQRYDEPVKEDFEWFVSLAECLSQSPVFKQMLMSKVAAKAKVLEIGCGTSGMSRDLFALGFRSIKAMDYQQKAVDYQNLNKGDTGIVYEVMDLRNLKYEDGVFDVVFDKGTFDALLCKSREDLKKGVEEVWRVMKASDTSMLVVLTNSPLMDMADVLKPLFETGFNVLIKNEKAGQFMAKLYVLKRRKKRL